MVIQQDVQLEVFKRQTSAEKLRLAFNLFDFTRQRIVSEITRQNPHLKFAEVNQIVIHRLSR
jgi:hypothetical protein